MLGNFSMNQLSIKCNKKGRKKGHHKPKLMSSNCLLCLAKSKTQRYSLYNDLKKRKGKSHHNRTHECMLVTFPWKTTESIYWLSKHLLISFLIDRSLINWPVSVRSLYVVCVGSLQVLLLLSTFQRHAS